MDDVKHHWCIGPRWNTDVTYGLDQSYQFIQFIHEIAVASTNRDNPQRGHAQQLLCENLK